jgi:carboxyl-terminal processing protease
MRRSIKSIALVCSGLIAGVALTLQLSATAQQGSSSLPLDELRNLSNVFG